MRSAAHRFDNDLRRRPENDPAQVHLTPGYILAPVREALGGSIGLDPCTTPDNPAGADRFYCPPADGARLPWDAPSVFVNPPYGEARIRWVRRCISAAMAGAQVVLLIPAATDTRIFQQALAEAGEVVFLRGRVKFGGSRPNGRQVAASHPSALIGWNTDLTPCAVLGVRAPLARPDGPPRLFLPAAFPPVPDPPGTLTALVLAEHAQGRPGADPEPEVHGAEHAADDGRRQVRGADRPDGDRRGEQDAHGPDGTPRTAP